VSDAWTPQVNGVVRTLKTTIGELMARGHQVEAITPEDFRTIPCPSYPEIRLAIGCGRTVAARLRTFDPDAVHIATEGPLGWAARGYCRKHDLDFSTSFHTRFPDYVAMRTGLPAGLFWPIVRHFHRPAGSIMVATETLASELHARGLEQTHRWSRGVDLSLFSGSATRRAEFAHLPGPIMLYVGRVAVEKNIAAFLDANVAGTRIVVGDGPAAAALKIRYPEVHFLGALHGPSLAAAYASADVFVFPSRTDTFGLVMIEALASGTPVAAFPVPGPLDIIGREDRLGEIGVMDEDLATAIRRALVLDRGLCTREGQRYSWANSTDQFVAALRPARECRPSFAARDSRVPAA
jgi:glycosyltransferase involved in cell wall biosynthesis